MAKVGMMLMDSTYVALRFSNAVPEVQRAVHKQYLIGLLVGNCKAFASKPCGLRVISSFLTF